MSKVSVVLALLIITTSSDAIDYNDLVSVVNYNDIVGCKCVDCKCVDCKCTGDQCACDGCKPEVTIETASWCHWCHKFTSEYNKNPEKYSYTLKVVVNENPNYPLPKITWKTDQSYRYNQYVHPDVIEKYLYGNK